MFETEINVSICVLPYRTACRILETLIGKSVLAALSIESPGGLDRSWVVGKLGA